MRARFSQRGLTLLELLVAFAIMALSIGLIYRILGSNARGVGDLEVRQRATVLAQSLLALRDTVPEGGFQQAGESGGFRWTVQSAPYATGVSGPSVTALHELAIMITWEEGGQSRSLELSTLRPQRKPAPQVRR